MLPFIVCWEIENILMLTSDFHFFLTEKSIFSLIESFENNTYYTFTVLNIFLLISIVLL